jgi:hypothetical protein
MDKKKYHLFGKKVPIELLFELLDKICSSVEGVREGKRIYYFIHLDIYRKMIFEGLLDSFLSRLREYYLPCFQIKYLDREITYKRFNTLVRHICKLWNLEWEVLEQQDDSDHVRYNIWV